MAPPAHAITQPAVTTVFVTTDPADPAAWGSVSQVDVSLVNVRPQRPALRDNWATHYFDVNSDGTPDIKEQWSLNPGGRAGFVLNTNISDAERSDFHTARAYWVRVAHVVNNGIGFEKTTTTPPNAPLHQVGVSYDLPLKGCQLFLYKTPQPESTSRYGSFVYCERGSSLLNNPLPVTFVFPISEVSAYHTRITEAERAVTK